MSSPASGPPSLLLSAASANLRDATALRDPCTYVSADA
jgi:hypothetical protein